MKAAITILCFAVLLQGAAYAQDSSWLNNTNTINSGWLKNIQAELNTARQDTRRTLALAELGNYYKFKLPDSSLFYGNEALRLARQIHYPDGEVIALFNIAYTHTLLGNDSKAFQIILRGLKIAEEHNLPDRIATGRHHLALVYQHVNNYPQALANFKRSLALFDSIGNPDGSVIARTGLVETYLKMNQVDSALNYNLSLANGLETANPEQAWIVCTTLRYLGMIEAKKGNTDDALIYLRQSLHVSPEIKLAINSLFAMAEVHRQAGDKDSCIYYAEKSLEFARSRGFYSNIINANLLLSSVYKTDDPQKALEYSAAAVAYKDTLANLEKITSFESSMAFDDQERRYEIETARTNYRNQIRQYALITGLLAFMLIVFVLYRNNRNKQKAKERIEKAYGVLKATQTQLIHSEKMASLGDLTAGIAHEIQNPLNFVNNFSDVNKELLSEMKDEIRKGNQQKAESLADDVIANQEKINQHGMKAGAIVKNMLQHSRGSSGKKELTDVNALADEYLRMAYHGQRAKDKSFIVKIETDFDSSIGKVNIVPQDIGRVFLNLLSNAFYAVSEKTNLRASRYEPRVVVSTKKSGDKVEIMIEDNGSGIPKKIVDKIFQPFFTTKPTGKGTGLGLSLAYDIIKAHGGDIKVETKEGAGTEFILQLPITPDIP